MPALPIIRITATKGVFMVTHGGRQSIYLPPAKRQAISSSFLRNYDCAYYFPFF